MERHFQTNPRPDPDVVQALEIVLAAARLGRIRSIALVTVNPVYDVESHAVGELKGTFRHGLISGLSSAAHKLMRGL